MPRTNDRALTVRLPNALYEQLSDAAREDRTVASLLRLLARQHLADTRSGDSSKSEDCVA